MKKVWEWFMFVPNDVKAAVRWTCGFGANDSAGPHVSQLQQTGSRAINSVKLLIGLLAQLPGPNQKGPSASCGGERRARPKSVNHNS